MIRPAEQRLKFGIAVVGVGVLLAFLGNDILSRIDFRTERWVQPYMFPLVLPVGADFREGLYYPAKILLQGKSPYLEYHFIYPPFTALLASVFRLLPVDSAYKLQVLLLYGLNISTIWGAVKIGDLARETEAASYMRMTIVNAVFLLTSFLIISSYGFLFSIERGNFDVYVQAAAILGLWLMLRKPERIWLQTLAFSVAVHLKIYPAILFLLLVWRHGRRSLLPLAVINVLLLLSTGPANAIRFVEVMVRYAGRPFLWVGNHSAASFGQLVNEYLVSRAGFQLPTIVFYVLPTAVWLTGMVLLWKQGVSPAGAVWMYALSVPMMSVIPSTSHDYKLVLLGAPVAMVLYGLLNDFAVSGRWIQLSQIGAAGFLMLFLTQSYGVLPTVLGNKYPFLIALELVFVWALSTSKSNVTPVSGLNGLASAFRHGPIAQS